MIRHFGSWEHFGARPKMFQIVRFLIQGKHFLTFLPRRIPPIGGSPPIARPRTGIIRVWRHLPPY
jgi:hypothetical protein